MKSVASTPTTDIRLWITNRFLTGKSLPKPACGTRSNPAFRTVLFAVLGCLSSILGAAVDEEKAESSAIFEMEDLREGMRIPNVVA
jgi:hypothetical protein